MGWNCCPPATHTVLHIDLTFCAAFEFINVNVIQSLMYFLWRVLQCKSAEVAFAVQSF